MLRDCAIGLVTGPNRSSPLGAIKESNFDKVFGVNAKGTLFTVQKALPPMRAGSTIILNAPMAGSKACLPSVSKSKSKLLARPRRVRLPALGQWSCANARWA